MQSWFFTGVVSRWVERVDTKQTLAIRTFFWPSRFVDCACLLRKREETDIGFNSCLCPSSFSTTSPWHAWSVVSLLSISGMTVTFVLIHGIKYIIPWRVLVNSLFGRDEMVKRYGKVIIWATVIWGVASIIVIFLICRPFSYSWDTSQPGSCGNRNDMYIINGIGNMLLDIAILVLPLPTIWKLKLPTAQKVGLALIFSLGIL